MNRKIVGFALGATLFALCVSAEAQHPAKMPRVGYLSGTDPKGSVSLLEGFRQGLKDHGYIEGKNIIVEYRFAEGKVDRIPSLVAELVQLNVDAIVSSNFTAIQLRKRRARRCLLSW